MMQSSMVTNNSMMRDSAGASPVPDKERNPSMRSKALGGLLAAALSLSPAVAIGVQTAYAAGGDTAATEYTLYPKPHSIRYDSGQYILRDINVIYDDDIDEATQDRLDEVAALKNLNVTESDAAVSGKTNVYVGVNGSDGKAETAIESKYSPDSAIFDKTDSYFLKSDNGTISVLGKDTDASFYGLTTLYQVLGQIDSLTIRNFTVTDYADVVSRGFIEGYYGNPWSTQDRINLMKWGGYYKLNSYFYAPKDDPKHNSQWRTLYTQDELDTKIKPLADAGNASKTRFVFALHPFMNNAIRFNSEANYQADLKVLQDKFAQTIGVGVRQIAILADDAANVGGNNYTKLLTDMVAWLKEMKKNPIKHTSCVIRSERAMEAFQSAVDDGAIVASRIDDSKMLRSQKRALVFKFNAAKAKQEMFEKMGRKLNVDVSCKCKWNHRLAFKLGWRNMKFSREKLAKLEKMPTWFIYYYMCFIRVLLSF